MMMFSIAAAPAAAGADNHAIFAIGALIALAVAWAGAGAFLRAMRARKAEAATGGRYGDFVLEALVNAAKVDGRVRPEEREAISHALAEATGAVIDPAVLDNAFQHAKLSKAELIAYLGARSGQFSHAEKAGLLKALMSVFVADGRFDEVEHGVLIDYTAAVGFDRGSAPQALRAAASSIKRGNMI